MLDDGESTSIVLEGTGIALCRVAGRLYAYLDRCPRCASGIGGAGVADGSLGCPGCGERFDVRLAGRGSEEGLHLDPLPLLGDADAVRIAVSSGAVR